MQARVPGLIVEAVHEAVGRRPVILCGSRATGESEPDSDFDVVVVVPAWQLPAAARRLPRAARRLEAELDAEVSLNPVRRGLLDDPGSNLFAWKLRREARSLYPEGEQLPQGDAPGISDAAAFSLMLSAVFFMLDSIEPGDLEGDRLGAGPARGARKALLHVGQLRLLRAGSYASTLEEVLRELGDPKLEALAGRLEDPEGWVAVRDLLLDALREAPLRQSRPRSLVRNAQYAGLSAVRGRTRLWALGARRPVEAGLAAAAVRLLEAVGPGGVDRRATEEAAAALPPRLRPSGQADWSALRSVCSSEWASAHPLTGF